MTRKKKIFKSFQKIIKNFAIGQLLNILKSTIIANFFNLAPIYGNLP